MAIQGRNDQYGSMAQLDVLERGLSGEFRRLELTDCHHAPHLEQADRTVAAVTDFVKQVK